MAWIPIKASAPHSRINAQGEGGSLLGLRSAFPGYKLAKVHDEHVAFGYGVRVGERYCRPCASGRGVMQIEHLSRAGQYPY